MKRIHNKYLKTLKELGNIYFLYYNYPLIINFLPKISKKIEAIFRIFLKKA